MSAFLVEHEVIQVLATFISQRQGDKSKYPFVEDVAEVLAKENLRSLDYRYSAEYGSRLSGGADEFLTKGPDGSTTETRQSYIADCQQLVVYSGISDADLAGLFSFYNYQACEHPDYMESEARKLVEYGENRLYQRLQNKSEIWGLPEDADIRPVTDITGYFIDREFDYQMDKPI